MEDRIRQNLTSIRQRVDSAAARVGRLTSDVTLIAVTKSVGLEEIRILRGLGVTHFGENRVDTAREKIERLDDSALTWHMVGNVQRRKAKEALRLFDTIDTVDRISLAETLQRHCDLENSQCRVSIEVNVSGEAQKHGFAPKVLAEALGRIAALERIRVEGLLCMAPRDLERSALIALFRELRVLADAHSISNVSMGMSGDFEEAVEAGATHVRVGRALFV